MTWMRRRICFNIVSRTTEKYGQIARPRHRRVDNTKRDLKKIGWDDFDWIFFSFSLSIHGHLF